VHAWSYGIHCVRVLHVLRSERERAYGVISRIPADAAAASCPMGEEHVLAIIEHIISTCTPVAEAHRLLSILQGAGTVPWKTLEPYVKVLRQWQSECGRHAVQSQDLRIQVQILPCMQDLFWRAQYQSGC